MSHKGQKQFNIIVIKFKNSLAYIQRKINTILRVYRIFARVYVNNVIIFSRILKKHLTHLHTIFALFESFDITLLFKNFFLTISPSLY